MKGGRRDPRSISPPRKRRHLSTAISSSTSDECDIPSSASYSSVNPNWLRIYSWNINGISAFLQSSVACYLSTDGAKAGQGSKSRLRNFLQRHHWPHVLCLQEVKINPRDEASQRSVQRAINLGHGSDDGPSYTVNFCLPRDKYNAKGFGGKVYGVATIIRDDLLELQVQATREVDWDVEGRVLVTETKSKLAIFNIYAVNGTSNPYRDPLTGKLAGTRHDRKLLFHQSLLKECKHLEDKGYRLILAGDLNVAPAQIDGHPNLRTLPEQHVKNRADFNAKFLDGSDSSGLGAIDSFRQLHPQTRRYTYMPRNVPWAASCDRVDLILLSKSFGAEEVLKEADILMTEAERGPSDHVPLFVVLDVGNLGPSSG